MKKYINKFLKQKKLYLILELVFLLLIIGLILLLTVGKGSKQGETPAINNPEQPQVDIGTVDIINESSKSRPYAVMIDNSGDARKVQKGVQQAYMVYEILNYADGRTRFMALYKDADVKEIMPIRSSRHYHLDYVLENDAIYVHWGYSPKAQTDITSLEINNINGMVYGNTYFWTANISGVNVSHRRVTSTELLKKGTEKLGYKTETETPNLLKYETGLVNTQDMDNSKKADLIDIYYSNNDYTTYKYDAEKKVYIKFTNGKGHMDYATNSNVEVTNIITYQVRNFNLAGDNESRQDLENIGSGEGYFITNGYAVKINWSKECRSCQTKYTYANGTEVKLSDGNTFINIQPKDKKFVIE